MSTKTKTKAELLERLKKVQAIALRGEENEKQSAAAFLEKLMKKYGFTERDFEEEQTELAYYRYKTELEERLLSQIIYMIVGDRPLYVRRSARNNRPYKLTGVYCTAAERIEIEATYDFYKEALNHDLLMFYRAFIHKNQLFPPPELEVKT